MYKIIVSYDGTDFSGWQYQPHAPSVAQTLQDTFFCKFGCPIKILGASRTDAGVHALGQVAVFSADITLDCAAMLTAWNDALPASIVIRDLTRVSDTFHPMYGVQEKTYWYHFFLKRPLPFVERYGWFFRYPINFDLLQQALQMFVGTHDFRSFCTGTDMGENTTRTVTSVRLVYVRKFGAWRIEFKGPGFLRHMIRRIVGACMQVASKEDLTLAYLKTVLDEKNPKQKLLNAPAKGLCLYKIKYFLNKDHKDVCD